mmetsp:Transcript_812/g.874  ORF Transcript_812/g.874 Transcript_812/m.874 type:complete len:116 (-) Transcript_812:253-600(-)
MVAIEDRPGGGGGDRVLSPPSIGTQLRYRSLSRSSVTDHRSSLGFLLPLTHTHHPYVSCSTHGSNPPRTGTPDFVCGKPHTPTPHSPTPHSDQSRSLACLVEEWTLLSLSLSLLS